jgi:HEAT repeat protein
VIVFTQLLGVAEAKQPWFYESAGVLALTLLVLNICLLTGVHFFRLRRYLRRGQAERFRVRVEEILSGLDTQSSTREEQSLRREVGRFNELERPIAAAMLIERLRLVSSEERERSLQALRDAGVFDALFRSARRMMPWRRALAARTLGWTGSGEAVPVLLDLLSDRSRYVRESAARALGRIGDPRALPALGELYRAPGKVAAGVAYDALFAFGEAAEPVFAVGLRSPVEAVRVASSFGIAGLAERDAVRSLLEPLLADPSPRVRAAATARLSNVGGGSVPGALERASRDEEATVRSAAAEALGSYDDPLAVELVSVALGDADRDTAVRAGESLVRLSRLPSAGESASVALARLQEEWPVERALVYASLDVV